MLVSLWELFVQLNSYNWDKSRELYSFFKELAIPYKINWVHKIGNGINPNINLSNEQIASAVIGMLNEFLQDENPQIYDDTSSEFLLGVMSGKMVSCAMQGHCQKEFFCVESSGDVYPCDAFSYLSGADEYCYGNVLDKGKDVFTSKNRCVFQERDVSHILTCSVCENRKICNAGCLLDAESNDFLNTKSSFCSAYKKIFSYCRAIVDTQLQSVKT